MGLPTIIVKTFYRSGSAIKDRLGNGMGGPEESSNRLLQNETDLLYYHEVCMVDMRYNCNNL
jgi:hypothetical protein